MVTPTGRPPPHFAVSQGAHPVVARFVFHFGQPEALHQRWDVHPDPAAQALLQAVPPTERVVGRAGPGLHRARPRRLLLVGGAEFHPPAVLAQQRQQVVDDTRVVQQHGLTHGATLVIVLPGTLRVLAAKKQGKLLQYGERIWGITSGTTEERVALAIQKTEDFFRSLGLHTRLSEENIGDATIDEITRRFTERNVAFGEDRDVTAQVAREILISCK